jgi:hypothetical protein
MRGHRQHRTAEVGRRSAGTQANVGIVVLDRQRDGRRDTDAAAGSRACLGRDIGRMFAHGAHAQCTGSPRGYHVAVVFNFSSRLVVGQVQRDRYTDTRIPAHSTAVQRMGAGHVCSVVLRQHRHDSRSTADDCATGYYRFDRAVFDVDRHRAGDADVLAACARYCGSTHAVDDIGTGVGHGHRRHRGFDGRALRIDFRILSHARLGEIVSQVQCHGGTNAHLALHGGAVGNRVRVRVVSGLQSEAAARIDRAVVGKRCCCRGIGNVDADRSGDGHGPV